MLYYAYWFGLLALHGALLLATWYGQVVIVILLGLASSAAGLAKPPTLLENLPSGRYTD